MGSPAKCIYTGLLPSIDHEININTVVKTDKPEDKRNFFQKIFSSGKKNKDKKNK
jgi:hypothetical protein